MDTRPLRLTPTADLAAFHSVRAAFFLRRLGVGLPPDAWGRGGRTAGG